MIMKIKLEKNILIPLSLPPLKNDFLGHRLKSNPNIFRNYSHFLLQEKFYLSSIYQFLFEFYERQQKKIL